MPYCRCIYTTGISAAFKFKLRTSVKAVSGKFPVYKIAAVIYWYTGEEFKCRINKIKIIANANPISIAILSSLCGAYVMIVSVILYDEHLEKEYE